jgi:hypothetical protein
MSNLGNLVQQMKELGFDKVKIDEVIVLAEKEIVDVIIEDFALNADEKIVQEYMEKFEKAQQDIPKLQELLHKIMAHQYGQENIVKKKEELLSEYLQKIIDLTKQTKELHQKYSQGDPEAIKTVEEVKKSPILQNIVEEMEQEEKTTQDNG